MKTNEACAMIISVEKDKTFKIKLIPGVSRSNQILFELVCEKIPNITDVIKQYCFSIGIKSYFKNKSYNE